MIRKEQIVALIFIFSLLTGCAGGPSSGKPVSSGPALTADQQELRQRLLAHYQNWQGTPYRLGGNDRYGIDCSAYTQITVREVLRVNLPRTTLAQSGVGQTIAPDWLQPGDLLFFNSSRKVRHVGIYIGEGEFIHASTSRGVMVSELTNPYWQSTFWHARRIY